MNPLMYWLSIILGGALFGAGLTMATMVQPEAVLAFLNFDNFGLLLVLGSATTLTLLVYQVAKRVMQKPFFAEKFEVRLDKSTKQTLIGAGIFGIGWGISGVCPGPAIAGLGTGNWPLLLTLLGMLLGAYIQGRWFNR